MLTSVECRPRRNWLLFDYLESPCHWMRTPVVDWQNSEDFCTLEQTVKNLKVVNDPAERMVKLVRLCHNDHQRPKAVRMISILYSMLKNTGSSSQNVKGWHLN